ncbi:MAG: hypothetical protein RLZZ461_1614 [Planctomycetota bacterium]|jgi:hypothetical protein
MRFITAAALTLLALPCLGFGVFGMLASFEVTGTERWTAFAIYAVIDLGLLLATVFVWRWALRPARIPGTCINCGYELWGIDPDRCPECGATIETVDR